METIANKKTLKTAKIIYWICTGILALFLLSGAFFINSKMALDAMHHLGVPEWFRWELSIGHIIGGVLLLLPVGWRLKEWNYVALGIDYISATIAYVSVDGPAPFSFQPLISMALLIVSYVYYHKINSPVINPGKTLANKKVN
ncbi:MAG TPA: DoxX family protein [Chitinophagaceae bacterium]|nr:DoxX family protein [Chitinophagaceae bacterium]